MSLIEQLVDIYLNEETWSQPKLSRADATRYFEHILDKGNLIMVCDKELLAGYVESWRITYEQWGKIICGEKISPLDQDVQSGYIAYIAGLYIRPAYRRTGVFKQLRRRFIEENRRCIYFVGEARTKKAAPIKVFKRQEILMEALNER